MTLAEVLERFPDAKKSGNGWMACCPAHEDREPSLSINEGRDGRTLMNCFGEGCTVDAICESVGLKPADLFPRTPLASTSTSTEPRLSQRKLGKRSQREPKPDGKMFDTSAEAVRYIESKKGRKADHSWTYHDADREPVGIILRWNLPHGEKDIRPVSRNADGWRIGGMPGPRPLYRLKELAQADRVYVCEGEKAAEAARSIGLTATTSAHGSKSAKQTDWGPLAGKLVIILPDNDAPGWQYAEDVMRIVMRLDPPAVVKVVYLPDLPEKGDIVDWLAARRNAAEPNTLRTMVEEMADTAEPMTLTRPASSIDRFQPFPVDALPEPLSEFVRAGSKAIGCDPSFIALPMLSVCGAAIGNTARLELKGNWIVPPIIWSVIVGESGTAKTPAFKLVMKPVQDRQHAAMKRHTKAVQEYLTQLAWYKKKLGLWEKQKESSDEPPRLPDEPQAERLVIEDTTVEAVALLLAANPRGLLLGRDELSGWFGSFDKYANGKGGADAAHWLSMFDAKSLTVDRKTGTPRTISVENAAVCITGGIQPGILTRTLRTEHRESGMAARFLLAFPPRRTQRWTDEEITPQQGAHYAEILDRLNEMPLARRDDGQFLPRVIGLLPGAKTVFTTFYDRNGEEQQELYGELSAAWTKLSEYPGRLALVIHLVRWAANDPTLESVDSVDETSMSAAVRLVEWFKHEARRVYALLDESETEREQRRLLGWIERKGHPVTPREVQQGCRWLRGPSEAERALQSLVEAGEGTWLASPKGQPGHPTRRFQLTGDNGIPVYPESDGIP